MWNEAIMAYLEALSLLVPGETEEKYGEWQ
jgi:hypothetical protein